MNLLLTLCLLACLIVIPHQYYQDYLHKLNEITFYHKYVMPPIGCGPAVKTIHEIGWLEWSGYTIWKQQQDKNCMSYVSKITQNPLPNLSYSVVTGLSGILRIPFLILSSYVAWIFFFTVLLVGSSILYYSLNNQSPIELNKEQVWLMKELKEIFRSDEQIVKTQFLHSSDNNIGMPG